MISIRRNDDEAKAGELLLKVVFIALKTPQHVYNTANKFPLVSSVQVLNSVLFILDTLELFIKVFHRFVCPSCALVVL